MSLIGIEVLVYSIFSKTSGFSSSGVKIVFLCLCKDDNFDIVVFNTCCIRDTAEQKILGHIGKLKKIKRANPKLIVAVVGCMSGQKGKSEVS